MTEHATAVCRAADCTNTVVQPPSGRRKRFCSDACRIRVHRRNETPPAPVTQLGGFKRLHAQNACFVTSKINDLAKRKSTLIARSRGGIRGPDYVIRSVTNARDWEEVVSSDGVVSFVSRIGQRALREETPWQD
jgi:hypothetical protein